MKRPPEGSSSRPGAFRGRGCAGALACLALAWLSACAGRPPAEDTTNLSQTLSDERRIVALARRGEFSEARRVAEGMTASPLVEDREIGTYWKLLLWVNEGQLDSAAHLSDTLSTEWTSHIRKLHADALFQTLAAWRDQRRSEVQETPRVAARDEKNLRSKVQSLERRNLELEGEVERLEGLRRRYESLMRELETIH